MRGRSQNTFQPTVKAASLGGGSINLREVEERKLFGLSSEVLTANRLTCEWLKIAKIKNSMSVIPPTFRFLHLRFCRRRKYEIRRMWSETLPISEADMDPALDDETSGRLLALKRKYEHLLNAPTFNLDETE